MSGHCLNTKFPFVKVDAAAMDKAMIHCAIAADDSEMVKLLLKFNANLEIGVS